MSLPERVKTKMKDAGLRAVNKPQRLNDSSSKSHHVMASEGGKYKYIKFGQEGVKLTRLLGNEKLLNLDTLRILKRVKCLQHTGQIKLSGLLLRLLLLLRNGRKVPDGS